MINFFRRSAFILLAVAGLALYAGASMLASCSSVPIVVEACFIDEAVGKVCATYSAKDGLFIKADVTGSPDLRSKIEEWARSLGWKGN